MKLSVSNIAWPRSLEAEALACLRRLGISAIEVAPSLVWPDWIGASAAAAGDQLRAWNAQGMQVSSLQAILFARPGLLLFGDSSAQENLLAHLEFCATLSEGFRATTLVLGAPRNRQKGSLSLDSAMEIAAGLLRRVAPAFSSRGSALCIEPNPASYGCDFATSTKDAARLVRLIDHPGVRLHLDTACAFLAGEDIAEAIHEHADILGHFHVAEPQLGNFSSPQASHDEAAAALEAIGYRGWITLEMRATATPLESLFAALVYLVRTYGLPGRRAAGHGV